MLRLCDILFSIFGIVIFLPVFIFILVICYFDTGSPFFRQSRVGRHRRPFDLIKLRTMKVGTCSVASHLVSPSAITPFGNFLRRTKLDELPQLWNVLNNDMSLVGPRPCLYNQYKLIAERDARGVFSARPGITGLAQVKKIDMSTPELLAVTDQHMLTSLSLKNYFSYIIQTIRGRGVGDSVNA